MDEDDGNTTNLFDDGVTGPELVNKGFFVRYGIVRQFSKQTYLPVIPFFGVISLGYFQDFPTFSGLILNFKGAINPIWDIVFKSNSHCVKFQICNKI